MADPAQNNDLVKRPFSPLSLDNWVSLGKIFAVFAAIFYGLGLIVTNEYLAGIWVSDFSLLRPRCIITGAWSAFVLVLGILPAYAPYYLLTHLKPKISLWKKAFGALVAFCTGWMISSIASFLLVLISADMKIDFPAGFYTPFGLPHEIATIAEIYLGFLVFAFVMFRTPGTTAILKPAAIGAFVIAAAVSTWTVAHQIYPHVPDAMGGGQPVPIALVFDAKNAEVWETVCGTGPAGKAIVTGPVDLLYRTDSYSLIQLHEMNSNSKGQIVRLDNKIVGATLLRNFCGWNSCMPERCDKASLTK